MNVYFFYVTSFRMLKYGCGVRGIYHLFHRRFGVLLLGELMRRIIASRNNLLCVKCCVISMTTAAVAMAVTAIQRIRLESVSNRFDPRNDFATKLPKVASLEENHFSYTRQTDGHLLSVEFENRRFEVAHRHTTLETIR